MKIGTYYYPEQWPREQWTRDFDHIARMGLQIVHMAEFAWFAMEPTPGEIRLDWLEECVNLAAERELDVILCTPTAAPPVWLADQFPETLPVDQHGTRRRFGGRRHYNPLSVKLQEATWRIVTAMAQRFGKHEAVIGWQIDNEYSGPFDQSETTHRAFRSWLTKKYGTIQELNRAWGNQFWNTYYTTFDQVMMPPSRDPGYDNPHHHLDASRFWSHAFAEFNRLQAEILRKHVGKRFITTNFMPLHLDANPADMRKDLTLFGWDSYPVTGWGRAMTDESYRLADPNGIELAHDHMASFNGRWALMEVQVGQTNWSGVPVLLYPGAVRLWLWTAIAHGCEFITVYRFRQPRFGQELFHHGLVGWDGVTETEGGREFAQVADELKLLDLGDDANPTVSADDGDAIGLLLDFEQLWYYASYPQARRWNQPQHLGRWYGAIARLGLPVKILHPDQPWPKNLKAIVAPGVQMVDAELVSRWKQYVEQGGHLVLTCRTGLMDRTGQTWEGPTAAPILDLIGGSIEAYDGMPEDTWGRVTLDDEEYTWCVWGDLLYAPEGTKVLGKYADQFYAETAAILQHAVGKGTVTYCGVYAEQPLADALVERVARQVGIEPTILPSRLRIGRRGKYTIALNYDDKPVDIPGVEGARFVLGGRRLPPAGVAVWTDR
jgi:beta-galactosidase